MLLVERVRSTDLQKMSGKNSVDASQCMLLEMFLKYMSFTGYRGEIQTEEGYKVALLFDFDPSIGQSKLITLSSFSMPATAFSGAEHIMSRPYQSVTP